MKLHNRTLAIGACFAALDAAALVLAQEPAPQPLPRSTSRIVVGFVLDRDTRQPLTGATVQVQPNLMVSTDQNGHFTFESLAAPPFRVVAGAAGYQSSFSLADGQTPLELALVKLAAIRGVLIDADTRNPVAHVLVSVGPAPGPSPFSAVTADDGTFLIQGVNGGGQYYLRIDAGPKPSIVKISAEEAKSDEGQKHREAAERQSFGVLYWPGGGPEIPNFGLLHGSDGLADLGEIRLRKARLRTLAAWLDGDCEVDDVVEVALEPVQAQRAASAEIRYGGAFEVQNLPEGSFVLGAMVIGHGVRQMTSLEIDGHTRGPVALHLAKPVPLTGVIELEGVSAADFPGDLANLPIQIAVQSPVASQTKIQRVAPNGFEALVYPGETYRLIVNLPPELDRYYIKQVIHDGAPVEDFRFRTFGGALRIVMSNHPAILAVLVQVGDKPQPGVTVVAGKEGGERGLQTTYLHDAQTNSQGRAVFRGLEPGRYRAIALTPSGVSNLLSVDNATLMSGGTAVTLEEGQMADLSLTVK